MRRKIVVIVLTAAQVVLYAALLARGLEVWRSAGWAGLGYKVAVGGQEVAGVLAPLTRRSREVLVVAPGSPAARADIAQGDLVVSVDGVAPTELERLKSRAAAARPGDTVSYRLQRDGAERTVTLVLASPLSSAVILVGLVSSAALGLANLVISFLVYWSRPRSRQARVFYLVCAVSAAAFFGWAAMEPGFPDLRGIAPMGVDLWLLAALAGYGLLSLLLVDLLLHLTLVFPRERPAVIRRPGLVTWLHVAPFVPLACLVATVAAAYAARWGPAAVVPGTAAAVAAAAAAATALIRRARRLGPVDAAAASPWLVTALLVVLAAIPGPLLRGGSRALAFNFGIAAGLGATAWFMGVILLYSVLSCIALYRSYREAGVEEKHQIRWPLWGTFAALGGSVAVAVVAVAFSFLSHASGPDALVLNVSVATLSKAFFLLIPLSFAFAILKHRLLDIDVIIRKTVVYSGVTGLLLLAYMVLAGALGLTLVRYAGVTDQTVAVVATVLVAAVFVPLRNRVQSWVGRRFFRRERGLQDALERIGRTIAGAAGVDALAAGAAEDLQRALQSRSVAVLVAATGRAELQPRATLGLADRAAARVALAPSSPLLSGSSPVADLQRWPTAGDDGDRLRRTGTALVASLAAQGEVYGAVLLGRRLDGSGYDDGDIAFLADAAEQLGLALAALHGRRAGREFAQARLIQEALLPSEIPAIAGLDVAARWLPAREVSGDYYDLLPLSGARLGVCIGDVSGKGLAASLLMSGLQAALKAVVDEDVSPASVCERVRSVVRRTLSGGRFVTFFYAAVDPGAPAVRFANAGHLPPMLRRADGSVLRLDRGGPAFARVLEGQGYDEGTAALAPGDRLVLFTDGVTEALGPEGEMFGEERLAALVRDAGAGSAEALVAAIVAAVESFAGGERHDDLTLVVVGFA